MRRYSQFAVVLGSGLLEDGSPTPVTELRARAAASLSKEKHLKLILSGSRSPSDTSDHGKTEAGVMAEIAASEGVERKRLLIEDRSFDTFGNAIFTVDRYLKRRKGGTLYVVTSPFHMERAVFIFKHVLGEGWTVIAHPCEEWSNETRQSGAPEAMVRARAFFEGIETGDLRACKKKLLSRIPAYKRKRKAA
ncbi:MAG: YdcF family protein [Candidatus Melainabacteria bacterium]|nr:YdcF family protein [Candidatus Melainabacteria bacterium]